MKRNLLLLKQLLGLKEIIDSGQIQRAAVKNGIRQSNLSHLIADFEKEIGCSLLTRSASGVAPTNTAQLLYAEVQKIFDILEGVNTSFIKADDLSGTLNVWTDMGIVGSYIIKNLSDFFATYPKIRLNILTAENIDLKNVDVAIVDKQKHMIPHNVKPLFHLKTHVRFYTTQAYLDTHGTPKDLEDLLMNYDLCLRQADLDLPEVNHLFKKAKHLNTISDSNAVIFRLILNGGGFSLFPEWMADLSPELIPVQSVDFSFDCTFVAFCPKKNLDPRVLLYIEHTKKANESLLVFE